MGKINNGPLPNAPEFLREPKSREEFDAEWQKLPSFDDIAGGRGVVPIVELLENLPTPSTEDWLDHTRTVPESEIAPLIERVAFESRQNRADPVDIGTIVESFYELHDWNKVRGKLQEVFENSDLPSKLDLIHFTKTLATFSTAHGDLHADNLEPMQDFLISIIEETSYPLLQYAAFAAIKNIMQERYFSTAGKDDYEVTQSRGRINEVRDGEFHLLGKSGVTSLLSNCNNTIQLARDTSITFDKTGLPLFYAPSSRSESSAIASTLNLINEELVNFEETRCLDIAEVLRKINARLVLPIAKLRGVAPEEVWHDFAPHYTSGRWRDVLNQLNGQLDNDNSLLIKGNVTAVEKFCKKFESKASVDDIHEDERRTLGKSLLNAFSASEDLHERFTYAVLFIRLFSSGNHSSTINELSMELSYLEVQLADAGFDAAVFKDLQNDHNDAPETDWALVEDSFTILNSLQKKLEKKIGDSNSISIDFEAKRLSEIRNDPDIYPFPINDNTDDALLLSHLYHPDIQKRIERDLGVQFEEIPLRSQVHLLRYLAGEEHGTYHQVMNLINSHPELKADIAKAFLANAEDPKFVTHLLNCIEKLDRDSVRLIVSKYGEITDATNEVSDYLNRIDVDTHNQEESRVGITRRILKRANQFLEAFDPIVEGKDSVRTLSLNLENVRKEAILFASTFKELNSQNKDMKLTDISQTQIQVIDTSRIADDPKLKNEMIAIASDNWDGYDPRLKNLVIDEFVKALETPGKKFYLLTHQDTLVAFYGFDPLENGNLYWRSFNTRREVTGLGIGTAFCKVGLEIEAETHTIEALCHEDTPMLPHYKAMGFFVGGTISDFKGTGDKVYRIVFPKHQAIAA